MTIGSGLGAQLGMAAETTYGTGVAPSRFLEAESFSVDKVKNPATWSGLAAGRLVDRADGRVIVTRAATAAFNNLAVTNRDLGVLLNMIMGGTVTPLIQGAGPAYLQTHPLVDTAGKFATIQVGNPLTGGSVVPQTATGCKVTSASFECGVGELLMANVEWDARDVTEATGLATPSYPASRRPFSFADMAVKVGATTGTAASVTGNVRKVTLNIERSLKTDRFYAGGAGLKDEPITNDKVGISGSIETDYTTAAAFADRYRDDTPFALVWEFVGPLIASTFFQTIRFTLPVCYLNSGTPEVSGPDVVSPTFEFVAMNDLTNPPLTIEYISTDTAL